VNIDAAARREDAMSDRSVGRKAPPTRKLKKEQGASAPSTPQAEEKLVTQPGGRLSVGSRLEKAISELQGLQELLSSGDLDPHILEDFRDALNRVRNSAWAAQQYVARKESGQDIPSVRSLLAGERIRAAYHLCRSVSDDLKTDIEFQAGTLVELHEVTKILTEQLEGVIKKL
jgi:hypothetical protein